MNIEKEWLFNQHSNLDKQVVLEMIAICAYYKFVNRGSVSGNSEQDWLEAETEVNNRYQYWLQEIEQSLKVGIMASPTE